MRHLSALTTAAAIALIAALPGSAAADGAPTMALGNVTKGMRCTADTVIAGTDVVSFDVEVLDVVSGATPDDARILVRASGPNVERTGIGQGFSGSPMWCPAADGTPAIAGAISAGVGDYGNLIGLVTPIAAVLGTPVDPPASARRDVALLRSARPLTSPLTVSGFSAPVATALRRAAAKAGRTVITAPAGPRAIMAPQTLRPGSSVSALYAGGDFSVGAVGTVTYTDGDAVWAFGHPLDGSGRRSLALGDAYVYTVVNNPIGTEGLVSYKLASPVNDVGTLSYDGPNAIAGRIGRLPTSIPVTVTARDVDRHREITLHERVSDERAVGNPTGVPLLGALVPSITAEAAYEAFQGNPSQQSGDLCLTIALAVRKRPIRFCNHYVGAYAGAEGVAMSPMAADVGQALNLLAGYQFGAPAIAGVKVSMTLRRNRDEATLVSAKPVGTVRRGRVATFRLAYRMLGSGRKSTRTVRVRVPSRVTRGRRNVTFTGTEANVPMDAGAGEEDVVLDLSALVGDEKGSERPKPQKLDEIIAQIEGLHRPGGVSVGFSRRGAGPRVLTRERVLISGRTSTSVDVR